MKQLSMCGVRLFVLCQLLLLPTLLLAQSEQPKSAPPPIGQQLVREGDLALKLVGVLAVGTAKDEIEAETMLGNVGIAPRNGWIADYPVTPDIIGELHKSVRNAAASNKISMGVDEALKRLDTVKTDLKVTVNPATKVTAEETKSRTADNYPDQTVINNYYNNEGPPVVTYYAPPPDYYYLYAWVPFAFWWSDFWFPGFFVLRDFHRFAFVNNRAVFISNHFNDVRVHRVFRVDPVTRFRGRTFAGIGATSRKGFIPTGVPRSERTIFNGGRGRMAPSGRMMPSPSGGGALMERRMRR
ncbi:MAG TPA: hypothetical protein VGJ93_02170 [Desulfuromonadaceae bacterium]|jgi:hypothetical protein